MQNQIDILYQPLFLFIKKRIKSTEDAKDLTQEVFYKLVKSDYSEIDSLKSWVYAIARNTIIDYYRKKGLITEEIDKQPLGYMVEEESDEAIVAQQLSGCIAPFVSQLPDEYRKVMELSELQDVPQKEIAEQLDLNYATVRSKIQRGRKKLKAIVSDCCDVTQGGMGSIVDYQKRNGCGT